MSRVGGAVRVTFHGVRGSTPCHSDETRRYGGNTSCVSLEAPDEPPVLFDLGTGLRYYGRDQAHDGTFRGVCLLSHLHWDHTQGLPFFTPILEPGARLEVFAPSQDDGHSAGDVMESKIHPPMFPVSLSDLAGSFHFHDVDDTDFTVGSMQVHSRLVPHVGPTVGYRVEVGGRRIAYVPDHQQPLDGSMRLSDGALELMDRADVLIHDAQYTPPEFERKSTWGHCTIDFAVWAACTARVRRLVLFHHDPGRHDDELDALVRCARRVGERHGVEVIAAAEGMTLDL